MYICIHICTYVSYTHIHSGAIRLFCIHIRTYISYTHTQCTYIRIIYSYTHMYVHCVYGYMLRMWRYSYTYILTYTVTHILIYTVALFVG